MGFLDNEDLFQSWGKDEADKVKDGFAKDHITEEENSDRLLGLSAIFKTSWGKPSGDSDSDSFF